MLIKNWVETDYFLNNIKKKGIIKKILTSRISIVRHYAKNVIILVPSPANIYKDNEPIGVILKGKK